VELQDPADSQLLVEIQMDLQKVIEVSNETLFECLIKNILSLLK
jgi:hypothetical protein